MTQFFLSVQQCITHLRELIHEDFGEKILFVLPNLFSGGNPFFAVTVWTFLATTTGPLSEAIGGQEGHGVRSLGSAEDLAKACLLPSKNYGQCTARSGEKMEVLEMERKMLSKLQQQNALPEVV